MRLEYVGPTRAKRHSSSRGSAGACCRPRERTTRRPCRAARPATATTSSSTSRSGWDCRWPCCSSRVPAYWLWTRVKRVSSLVPWYCIALATPLLVHSLLEFPYAYAYFLAPVLFALGVLERSSGARHRCRCAPSRCFLAAFGCRCGDALVRRRVPPGRGGVQVRAFRATARRTDACRGMNRRSIRMLTQVGALLTGSRIELRPDMPASAAGRTPETGAALSLGEHAIPVCARPGIEWATGRGRSPVAGDAAATGREAVRAREERVRRAGAEPVPAVALDAPSLRAGRASDLDRRGRTSECAAWQLPAGLSRTGDTLESNLFILHRAVGLRSRSGEPPLAEPRHVRPLAGRRAVDVQLGVWPGTVVHCAGEWRPPSMGSGSRFDAAGRMGMAHSPLDPPGDALSRRRIAAGHLVGKCHQCSRRCAGDDGRSSRRGLAQCGASACASTSGLSAHFAPFMNQALVGEAYGNLRQPNQFASLCWLGVAVLLWGVPRLSSRIRMACARAACRGQCRLGVPNGPAPGRGADHIGGRLAGLGAAGPLAGLRCGPAGLRRGRGAAALGAGGGHGRASAANAVGSDDGRRRLRESARALVQRACRRSRTGRGSAGAGVNWTTPTS